ncbi:MAG TPA: hypothetical protein VKV95_17525 [Terriglobia bacterium]|nr:hypothetical protein [Terriglobia bacterium]
MALTIVMEGITTQYAGELLLDAATTGNDRRVWRATYLRSLMDFAFAAIFADVLVVSGNMPSVGGEHPGRDLLEFFKGLPATTGTAKRVIEIEPLAGITPKQLLESESEWKIVRGLIDQLATAIQADGQFWKEYMAREVLINLGDDSSLSLPKQNPLDYKFRREFFPDEKLQAAVPQEYVSAMLHSASLPANVCQEAMREFISRDVVAHIVIYRWYQKATISLEGSTLAHLPHATRASLRATKPKDLEGTIKKLIMPAVMLRILKRSWNRQEVLKAILNEACDNSYASFKAKLAETFDLLRNRDERSAQSLIRDIEMQAGQVGVETLRVGYLSTVPAGMDYRESLGYLLRGPGTTVADYEESAGRLFPELGGIYSTRAMLIPPSTAVALPTEGVIPPDLLIKAAVTGFSQESLELLTPVDQFLAANEHRISALANCFRTHQTAGEAIAICEFLRQFRSTEWVELGLTLLEHVNYFHRDRFVKIFSDFYEVLAEEVRNKATFAVLGGPQDSSNALAYFCSKAFVRVDKERFQTLVDLTRKYKSDEVVVFFIDDNLGSGGNAMQIFKGWLGIEERGNVAKLNVLEEAWLKSADLRYFVLIDFMDKGDAKLKEFLAEQGVRLQVHPAIATQESEGCFKSTANVFRDDRTREVARQMALSIGYDLLEDEQRPEEERRLFALGFGGSQKLIVFEWNTPTCTLPILWKAGRWQGNPWKPLFPRR